MQENSKEGEGRPRENTGKRKIVEQRERMETGKGKGRGEKERR